MLETMYLIDTHTHLFAEQFTKDRDEMVKRAIDSGVEKMLLPNIDSSTTVAMNRLHNAFPNNCYPMMGIHPSSIKENYKEEIAHAQFELLESDNKYWGIGETGLDYYWDTTFVKAQKDSLHQHAHWAKENSGAQLREVIKKIPLDCIVLETDSPYLSPVPYRGKRNESSYLLLVAKKLAEVLDVSMESLAEATSINAKHIFKL